MPMADPGRREADRWLRVLRRGLPSRRDLLRPAPSVMPCIGRPAGFGFAARSTAATARPPSTAGAKDVTGAERMRELRRRRRLGRVPLLVEVADTWPETLVELGRLKPEDAGDSAAVARATSQLLDGIEIAQIL